MPREAWLSGPIEGIPPLLLPAAHAFVQAAEDCALAAAGLTPEQLAARPGGVASIGFHLRHTAGATDRLLTYARGEMLSEAQRRTAGAEKEDAAADADLLTAALRTAVGAALEQLRATPEATLLDARAVGRDRLPSTVLGLIVHAAEHAARHAGQAVTTSRIVRAG